MIPIIMLPRTFPAPTNSHHGINIGTAISLAAIAVAYWIYRRQRRVKKLECRLVTQGPLFTTREEAEGKLQIFYGKRQVRDTKLVILRISNSGTEPILESDFNEPLNVNFGEGSEVLSAGVLSTSPEGLLPAVMTKGSSLKLSPMLLNQQDSISIKCFVEGGSKQPKVGGRVVGIPKIEWSSIAPRKNRSKFFPPALLACAALAGVVIVVKGAFTTIPLLYVYLFLCFAAGFGIWMLGDPD
jgi:hypothetical protein